MPDIDRVSDTISQAEGIRRWWTREAELEARPGFRTRAARIRVSELEPFRRIVWNVTHSDAPGVCGGTTITFVVTGAGEATKVTFSHRGFADANEAFHVVTRGWAYYLASLRRFLEPG